MIDLPSYRPPLAVVGRLVLAAGYLDGPVGVRLPQVPSGPISAMVTVRGGAIRWTADASLVTSDHWGVLTPAGGAFEVPSAADLRLVAAEDGATVDVVLLAPAEAA